MPVPMTTCEICGNLVTKRSTLALGALCGREGRACRAHTEIVELLEGLKKEREFKRILTEAQRMIRVRMMAVAIRQLHSFLGVPVAAILWRFRMAGVQEGLIMEAMKTVNADGGAKMSEEEMLKVVSGAAVLLQRGRLAS